MSDHGLVDAHHHLWDLRRRPQPWLDEDGNEPIRRSFGMADLRAAATRPIGGRPLRATVLVHCLATVEETRELLALAADEPLIGAVVGWADLTSPAIGDRIDELRAGRGGTRLRGLRHLVQGEADPAWLQRPEVERGLRAVQLRGLGYDLLIRSHQFEQGIRLAERWPGLPIVLDHAGKPPIAGRDLHGWERQVRRLAAYGNVVGKFSGLITEADRRGWTSPDIRPVAEVLLSAFGPERLMFGSDWPVCTLAGGWNRWAATVDELLSGCTADEADAVLGGTATSFYQLSSVPKGA
ncbi:amidohydrolase family protein [Actinoplanes oblitus]|uniref:Amidohydrolase family protein n=1 Tax=Actinoplanes oblitus TaxID=3040509 RepID=A0ABY8W8X8_9ACTN|nr:amidohydrolase family protein [Actinoplanes oblitus]WIM92834.1 amidohydrolase family protein [Actinoplanes oblitus]